MTTKYKTKNNSKLNYKETRIQYRSGYAYGDRKKCQNHTTQSFFVKPPTTVIKNEQLTPILVLISQKK